MLDKNNQPVLYHIKSEKKDNSIYSIASWIFNPDFVPEKIKDEIGKIRDSFKYIPKNS